MKNEETAELAPRYPVYACSPKALAKIEPTNVGKGEEATLKANAKYPFAVMKVGQSFAVAFNELKAGTLQSLRSLACKHSKAGSCKFAVIVHKDLQVVEVARIA